MQNSHPSEIARGLVFEERFTPESISRNRGVVTGVLGQDQAKGAYFDGTNDYITYPPNVQPFSSGFWSVVIEFTPNRAANNATTEYLFSSSNGYFCIYRTFEYIWVKSGNINAIVTPVAAFAPYWNVGARCSIELSLASGSNKHRFNGVEIDAEGNAWTPSSIASLFIGSANAGVSPFSGYIHSIKFFKGSVAADLLTIQEAIDYTNNSTFNYMSKATCILPMTMETYDPTNKLVRDSSGRGNNFTLGDGSTASTFPTKLATRGYSFDGGDYHRSAVALSGVYSVVALVCRTIPVNGVMFGCNPTGSISVSGAGVLASTSGTKYVNGSLDTQVPVGSINLVCVTGISLVNNTFTYIGTKDGSDKWVGPIFYFALFPFALTPLQIKDIYANLMKELQRV